MGGLGRGLAPIAVGCAVVCCLFWSLTAKRALGQDQPSGWQEMAPPQPPGPEEAQAPVGAVPQPFDATLSSYGNWVYVDPYGWSWQPDQNTVGPDFQPYLTGGSWVDTDDGWSFDNGSPWGDITFHYGRWYLDPNYGWLWLPGTQWAPAWVDWRFGGGYCGWAPLGPPGYVWRGGREAARSFVDVHHFGERNASQWVVRQPEQLHQVYASTARIQNSQQAQGVRWNAGPARAQLTSAGAPVPHVQRARPPALHLSSATVVPKPSGRPTPHPMTAPAAHAAEPHAAPAPRGPEHQAGQEHPQPTPRPNAPAAQPERPASHEVPPPSHAEPPAHAAPPAHAEPPAHAAPPAHAEPPAHAAPHQEPHEGGQPARQSPAPQSTSHTPHASHPAPAGHPQPEHQKEEHK